MTPCKWCPFSGCECPWQRADSSTGQEDSGSNVRAEMAQIGYPEKAGQATSKGAGNTPRGLTTGGSTPEQTERN